MPRLLQSIDELDDLRDRSFAALDRVMGRIVEAHVAGDGEKLQAAQADLATLLASTMGLADMLGRRRLLLEVDKRQGRKVQYAASTVTPLVPKVPFREAIKNLAARDSRLARSAADVSKLYSQEHAFAMARSASLKLTERVQEILVKQMQRGGDALGAQRRIVKASEVMQASKPFTLAYATTVYRNALSSSYTAGRFRLAQDPDVADYVLGFRFDATGDSDTRPNHMAGDGFMAATDDPVWMTRAVPLGHNCRCALVVQTRDDFKAARLLDKHGKVKPAKDRMPSGWAPDPGFGQGRPDLRLHGTR